MKAIWVSLALCVALAAYPVRSFAAASPPGTPGYCDKMGIQFAEWTWDGYFEQWSTPEGSHYPKWSEAIKHFNSMTKAVNACRPGKMTNVFAAYLSASEAVIHRHDGDSPQNEVNLAMQRFTKCASDFFATKIGAQCQTMTETIAKLKVAWMSERVHSE